MIPHGNSYRNKKLHHVYVIYDKDTDDVYKYGISHDPIEADGLSTRLRDQLVLFNRIANWQRFYAEILYRDLESRLAARQIEQRLIREYKEQSGHRPKGNLAD